MRKQLLGVVFAGLLALGTSQASAMDEQSAAVQGAVRFMSEASPAWFSLNLLPYDLKHATVEQVGGSYCVNFPTWGWHTLVRHDVVADAPPELMAKYAHVGIVAPDFREMPCDVILTSELVAKLRVLYASRGE
jgi:hypothetical protein